MKLCLVIVAAVAIATCYAHPVPKESVFAVYPVNSALAQHSTDQPFDTKPEQNAETIVAVAASKVVPAGKDAVAAPAEKPLDSKADSEQVKVLSLDEPKPVATPAVEASPKAEEPAAAVKSAPAEELTTKAAEPATTTVASEATKAEIAKDEARVETEHPAAIAEPKAIVPEVPQVKKVADPEPAPAPAVKVVSEDVKTSEEKVVAEATNTLKSAESVEKEEVKAAASTAEQPKPVEPAVKSDVKEEKPVAQPEPKAAVTSEARSAAKEEASAPEPQPEPKATEVKEEIKIAEPAIKPEPVAAAAETEAKNVAERKTNEPEPKTEGEAIEKPTKVRAAPIVEDLKVQQPVEAEPAITKIHVTVIQEEVPIERSAVTVKEVAAVKDEPKEVVAESKPADPAPVTKSVPVETVPVMKSDEAVVEKKSVTSDKPTPVESESATRDATTTAAVATEAKSTPAEEKKVELKEEAREVTLTKSIPEPVVPVVVVVPSVAAEQSDKVPATVVATPAATVDPVPVPVVKSEKAEEKVAPEVRAAPAVTEESPVVPAAVEKKGDKAEGQLAKAADAGSSQPGTPKATEAVKDESKDQSVGDSSTTTVKSVTEAEPAPTPARLKGKKQIPPNLRGYSKRLKLQEAQRKQHAEHE
ncbi:proteoglycan 4-like isoform X1 [Anopheles albimanus]|uniref:Uncharacterized protein n=1 Tax=Anopheles albimanus TaxID=7167 RepID=A0A8W7K6A4_ANOAL|nr:proteoglycan 4-like isoform X1 [Anopheles albimanus]XP_035775905.1 proteoglycan 4-like isoform X1 [Anopheles albimanus]XP_035775907.1 proteoglycan 4-like isoform X1 [Anopheles albimanus]XP_035775909.1 proteoglycan 4-like isoform X1 [Anopheles albimanus]